MFKWVGIQAKLDQTIQIQKSLKETSETILMKTEQNTEYCQLKEQIAGLQAKADQAITGQQELLKKTGLTLSTQQEFTKKADQALSGQEQLSETVAAAQALLDQHRGKI